MVGLIASALALFLTENEEFRMVVQALSRLWYAQDKEGTVLVPSADEPIQP